MGAKKDECRFTIQFSSLDARHLQVAKILKRQGRRKAHYLVNAVLCYENGAEAAEMAQQSPVNYHAIEAIVNQILADKAAQSDQLAPTIKGSTAKLGWTIRRSEDITFEDAAQALGEDGLAAIADSIAAF